MAKKNNLKSVRLSDQVMDYVINFEGDGFNQKFENLGPVLYGTGRNQKTKDCLFRPADC